MIYLGTTYLYIYIGHSQSDLFIINCVRVYVSACVCVRADLFLYSRQLVSMYDLGPDSRENLAGQ